MPCCRLCKAAFGAVVRVKWHWEEVRSGVSGGWVQIGSGWHAPEELCCLLHVRWGSKEGFELGTI